MVPPASPAQSTTLVLVHFLHNPAKSSTYKSLKCAESVRNVLCPHALVSGRVLEDRPVELFRGRSSGEMKR